MARQNGPRQSKAIPLAVVLIILILTSVSFAYTRHLADRQDRNVLAQRAAEVSTNISTIVTSQRTALRTLASNLQQGRNNAAAFAIDAQQAITSGGFRYVAYIDTHEPDDPTIVNSFGTATDANLTQVAQFRTAIQSLSVAQPFVTTNMVDHDSTRYVGLISGSPVVPAGHALYGEFVINPFDPRVSSALLGEQRDTQSALYSGDVATDNLVASSTDKLPLTGKLVHQNVLVGTSQWQLVVRERKPVADVLTRSVPWIIVGTGCVIAFLSYFFVSFTARRRDDALRLAKERSLENGSILEAAREAFISMDSSGTILRWSKQAEELFGFSSNEALGRQVAETIIPMEQRESHHHGLSRYLATGEGEIINRRIEVDALHQDGHTFPVELSVWDASDGTRSIFSAIAHDITERRKAAEDLAAVTQRALEASQLKSEFLANMSHEIRTPMNGVIGMTSLLLNSELDDQQREQAQVVKRSAEALLNVINDILDFSKIEAGKLSLEQSDFDLRHLIDDIQLMFSTLARQKGVDLRVELGADVPHHVHGDAGRIRQVLLNLVGNAIKFTADGTVTIKCDNEHQNGATRLYFEITDTGIGIAPEARDRLFKSFSQIDMSSARRHEGTGLGLVISSRLVALMDGEIGVRSEHGHGSTFWFSVVVASASSDASVPAPTVNDSLIEFDRVPSILVVEDNAVNQRVAEMTLRQLNCEVQLVDNGLAAVELVAQRSFDLVFMDCQMPGMDGYEATERIRASEVDGQHLVIVAMTASAMQGDRDRAMAVGMDDYLSKPVRMEDFIHSLNRWLGDNGSLKLPEQSLDTAEVEATEAQEVDLTMLESLCGSLEKPNAIYASIVNTFLSQSEDLLKEMTEAHAQDDRLRLAQAAHKLRGSSATVGAIAVARYCTDVEVLLADSHGASVPETIEKLTSSYERTKRLMLESLDGQTS